MLDVLGIEAQIAAVTGSVVSDTVCGVNTDMSADIYVSGHLSHREVPGSPAPSFRHIWDHLPVSLPYHKGLTVLTRSWTTKRLNVVGCAASRGRQTDIRSGKAETS